ncbi:MAG: hypothetical protein BWZ02_03301 [Lentisphaerae bacterium ADurb.BinA184]|nr:MAG: hypothetical protein BWZ02_03301 [Lentisphaerae bacterium ADurb.BinA184]
MHELVEAAVVTAAVAAGGVGPDVLAGIVGAVGIGIVEGEARGAAEGVQGGNAAGQDDGAGGGVGAGHEPGRAGALGGAGMGGEEVMLGVQFRVGVQAVALAVRAGGGIVAVPVRVQGCAGGGPTGGDAVVPEDVVAAEGAGGVDKAQARAGGAGIEGVACRQRFEAVVKGDGTGDHATGELGAGHGGEQDAAGGGDGEALNAHICLVADNEFVPEFGGTAAAAADDQGGGGGRL